MSARWRSAGAAVAGSLLLRLVYGPPRLGYDAWYALSWGRDLAHGMTPGFTEPMAPTPHPLANIVSAVLSVLGSRGVTAIAAISLLSLAVLGLAAFRIASGLFGTPAGLVVVVVVLTRPQLVDEMLYCSADIPFLALVTVAGAALVRPYRRERVALVALVFAGLLRPEAWLLAIVLAGWCWWRQTGPGRPWLLAGAFAAPLAWALFDLAVTGDPLHSLHGTRELAQQFGRPHSASTAVTAIPGYIRAVIGSEVAWAGAISALAALWLALERAALPLVVVALGLVGFLMLGATDLPLLYRYALLPGLALILLIGYGSFAWSLAGTDGLQQWALAAMGVGLAVLLGSSVPSTRDALLARTADNRHLHVAERDLARLSRSAALRGCHRVAVAGPRVVPELAYRLGLQAGQIVVAPRGRLAQAIAVDPVDARVAGEYRLTPTDPATLRPSQLRALRVVARSGAWAAYGGYAPFACNGA